MNDNSLVNKVLTILHTDNSSGKDIPAIFLLKYGDILSKKHFTYELTLSNYTPPNIA